MSYWTLLTLKFRFTESIYKVKVVPPLHRHKNFLSYRLGLHLVFHRRVLNLILDFKGTWIGARGVADGIKWSESQKAGPGYRSASVTNLSVTSVSLEMVSLDLSFMSFIVKALKSISLTLYYDVNAFCFSHSSSKGTL